MQSNTNGARFTDGRLRRWMLGPALAATLVAAPVFAQDLKDTAGMGDPVAADSVATNPQIYEGKHIFVEGYVDDIFGARLFELEKEPKISMTDVGPGRSGAGNHGHDLLVFVPDGVSFAGVDKNKKVRVIGTIQQGLTAQTDGVGSVKDLDKRAVLVVDRIEIK